MRLELGGEYELLCEKMGGVRSRAEVGCSAGRAEGPKNSSFRDCLGTTRWSMRGVSWGIRGTLSGWTLCPLSEEVDAEGLWDVMELMDAFAAYAAACGGRTMYSVEATNSTTEWGM